MNSAEETYLMNYTQYGVWNRDDEEVCEPDPDAERDFREDR